MQWHYGYITKKMDPYNLEIFIYTKCYLNNLEGGMDEGGMAQVEICRGSMLGTVVIPFCLLLWIFTALHYKKKSSPQNLYCTEIPFLIYETGKNSKVWQYAITVRLWENRNSLKLLVGMQNGTALPRWIWHHLTKSNVHFSYDWQSYLLL